MFYLRPLLDELFKYRKRKKHSIDGSVPGVPYRNYRRLTTPRFGSRSFNSNSRQPDYLGNIPSQYQPNIFAPSVDWSEYRQDHEDFIHIPHIPAPHNFSTRSLPENPITRTLTDELSICTVQYL